MSAPWMTTIATMATMPSATAIGTLSSDQREHADEHQRDGHRARPASALGVGRAVRHRLDRLGVDEARAARVAHQLRQAQRFGDHEQHRADRNDRLVTRSGIHGRLTSVSPPRTISTSKPVHAEHARRRRTRTASANDRRPRRAPCGGMRVDEAGHADVRALERRQRRAVIGQPDQADRGDLVVPEQRIAERSGSRSRRSPSSGQRRHQDDDDGSRAAARSPRASGRSQATLLRQGRPSAGPDSLRQTICRARATCRSAPCRPALPWRTRRRSACWPR